MEALIEKHTVARVLETGQKLSLRPESDQKNYPETTQKHYPKLPRSRQGITRAQQGHNKMLSLMAENYCIIREDGS